MAEISSELKTKIQRILGIHAGEIEQYDPYEIIAELCDTVFMFDEGNAVPQITALREKLTSMNGRIWSLLGHHDAKRTRENFNGIAELEKYVGELKRRSGRLEDAHERDRGQINSAEERRNETEDRVRKLEGMVVEIQEDLQNLFHTLMAVEALEDEVSES